MWVLNFFFAAGALFYTLSNSIFSRQMHSVAMITCPNSSVAEAIASTLVEKKMAACVNIIPSVRSIYLWKGKIEKDNEVLLIAKTQSKHITELTNTVKSIHPYECPEVISFKIDNGYPPYLQWIEDSTQE